MIPLDKIDLNQLRILASLLENRSVTQTARVLGMSQPAVSRALKTLRESFNDPILIKTSFGMTLTGRAEALRQPLNHWMQATQHLLHHPGANTTLAGPVRIATTDFGILAVVAPVMEQIIAQAPHLQLDITPLDADYLHKLSVGSVDIVISGYDPDPDRVHQRHLFREDYCCLFRRQHPLAALPDTQPLTLDEIYAWPHLMLSVNGMEVDPLGPYLDGSQPRQIAARLSHLTAAPLLLSSTDAILIGPRRLYGLLQRQFALAQRPVPRPLGSFDYWLLWHERNRRNPITQWVLEQLSLPFSGMTSIPDKAPLPAQ